MYPHLRCLIAVVALTCSNSTAEGQGATTGENGSLERRRAYLDPQDRATKFRSTEGVFPRRWVRAGDRVWPLKMDSGGREFDAEYVWKGATYSLAESHARLKTSALLVLRDDRLLVELHPAGGDERSRYHSFSTSKTMTSTLVGLALEDGLIRSVEDPLTTYLPALIGTAFDLATIQDALQMMTGVHDPEPTSLQDPSFPFVKQLRESMTEQRYRFVEGASSMRRERLPGLRFNYSTMNTALLGWLVETVAKKRLATYMEERLWKPAGMEADAAWLLDGSPELGREMAGGDFVAIARDYGRFGLLMLHQGRANGRQVVPERWIHAATHPDRPGIQCGSLSQGYPLGYGYNWWIFPNGRFTAQGVFGQFIYVAPDARMVIVKFSHWPEPWVPELEEETYALFEAILARHR